MTLPKIYGLIGYPVSHSLSPVMHNAAFSYLKIDAQYRLFPLKQEEVKDFLNIDNLKKNNIFGLNVTVPYKEKVIAFIDKLSKEAELIGAVNTIKRVGKRLLGFNTDGEGFLEHLVKDLRFSPRGKAIAIQGAGGAGRAIAVYLSKSKPKRISIYDIDKTKTRCLIRHLKENFKDSHFIYATNLSELDIEDADLFINATPWGMREDEPCKIDADFISKDILVYDLIYNPQETRLLKIARKKGAETACGLGMLLYQGMLSFEIWTGKKAPKRVMQKALHTAISKC